MNELTPRDDIKKKVSEILKRVDRLIRAGEVDQAMREIIQAKEIDPKNVYIFAYEERITYLKEEHEKHQQQEQTKKAAEEAARKRDYEAQRKAEEAARKRENELKRKAEEALREQEDARRQEVIRQVQALTPSSEAAPEEPKQDRRSIEELERELSELEADVRRKEEEERRLLQTSSPSQEHLERYQAELALAWEDGALTPLEDEHLKEIRMELGIPIQDHTRLTKKAQFDAYLTAFRKA